MNPLLRPEQFAARFREEPHAWFIADCRHSLSSAELGKSEFSAAHIPGAVHFHLDTDLSGEKTGLNGRHPLPDASAFYALLQKSGAGKKKYILAYDASDGIFASRFWWLCRWIGVADVFVLDGGWQAWQRLAEQERTSLEQLSYAGSSENTALVIDPNQAAFSPVNAQAILTNFEEEFFQVLDARSPERFRGEGETLDPIGGHIPMALNRFYKDNLDVDGFFKKPADLAGEFLKIIGKTKPQRIIHQCGSGVTACHNLLAMEAAGLHGSLLYPGSWSEWCSNPLRPIAK